MYQADGTFSVRSGSRVWQVNLPSTFQGGRYFLSSASSSNAVVIATVGAQLWELLCTASSASCTVSRGPLPLPLTSSSNSVLGIGKDDVYGQLILASIDTVMRFSSRTFSITSFLHWKPSVRLSLNTALIRESGLNNEFYISYANANNVSAPGMVVKVDSQFTTSIITYMSISSSNFVPTRDADGIILWTDTNSTSHKTYLNAYFSSTGSQQPATLALMPGESASPSFVGEYPMTQIGAIAVGTNTELGFSLQCFTFSYGMSPPPAITLTKRSSQGSAVGLPFLGLQENRLLPVVTAVARTAFGFAVVDIDFGSCPMSSFGSKNEALIKGEANINEKANSETSTARAQKDHLTYKHDDSSYINQQRKSSLFDNCFPSKCSFLSLGECPPQQCWAMEKGSFSCCRLPPFLN